MICKINTTMFFQTPPEGANMYVCGMFTSSHKIAYFFFFSLFLYIYVINLLNAPFDS